MGDALVLDYVRTPRGKASDSGALHHVPPARLLGLVLEALAERNPGLPAAAEDVVIGIASQVAEQGADLARTAVLLAGWPDAVPGVTVNRFCASGIDAVALAAARLRAGDAGVVVAGGVESVSRVPIFSDGGPLWTDPAVVQRVGSVHMGIAADLNATIEGWSREDLDAYALETHTKAAEATVSGAFDRAIVPVPVQETGSPGPAGTDEPAAPSARAGAVTRDELIRPNLTPEGLAALPPAFAAIGAAGQDALVAAKHPHVGPLRHLHTVGTSPQMADAAAGLVLGDAAAAERFGVAPRARILATATCAVDPVVMLTAGQLAVERVIERAGLRPADIDVFEFAEAFSSLCLRFRRDLGAGPERLNPFGGTMAMGHAFGATGAIMVGGCVDALHRLDGRYGVAAVSGAAGLGTAVLVERLG